MENAKEKIEKLESFLKQDPENARLASDLVDACMRAGNLPQAKFYVAYGLKRWPDNLSFHFQQGMLCLYSGEFQQAIDIFTALLDADVPQDVVKYNIAWACLALHRAQDSLDALETADASQSRIALLKARALHHLGLMDEAVALLPLAEADQDTASEARSMRAIIALDQEDTESARELAENLLQENPRDVEGNLVVGTLHLTDGELSAAETNFATALAEKPNSGRGWLGQGLLAMLRGEFVRSAEFLERAVELMPTHLGTYNALAWAYICAGDIDKAESAALRAKAIEPRFAETQGTLAVIALLKGDKSAAASQAKLASRLGANSFAGRFAQALIESNAGEQESAEATLEQILGSEINKQGETLVKALTRFQTKIEQDATIDNTDKE